MSSTADDQSRKTTSRSTAAPKSTGRGAEPAQRVPAIEPVQFIAPQLDPDSPPAAAQPLSGSATAPAGGSRTRSAPTRSSAGTKRPGERGTAGVESKPPIARSSSRAAVTGVTKSTNGPQSAGAKSASRPSQRSVDKRRKASECVVADPEELFESLGVSLKEPLLTLALTHRSWANEHGEVPTNERLEFLGDTVLGLVVTEQLYVSHPDKEEGELAKLRANVVSTVSLAEIARRLGGRGLGEYLYLGNGEVRTGGKDKDSILADGLEALLGAVHIQYGIEKAREVVLKLCAPLMARAARLGAGLDWKTSLQEICAKNGLRPPSYEVAEAGPDHEKLFTAVVLVEGKSLGTGSGRTKKEAEMKAAAHAWGVISGEDIAMPALGV